MSQALPETSPSGDRLARFRDLRERFSPAADPAGALASNVYEDHPHAASRRIAAELELAPSSSHILIGGVGSGKTTELLSTQRRLAAVPGLRPLFIDVSKGHDIGKTKQ